MNTELEIGKWVKAKIHTGEKLEGLFLGYCDTFPGIIEIAVEPDMTVRCPENNITHVGQSVFNDARDKKYKQILGPNQRKWINALKSGKYKQTQFRLCNRNEHRHYEYCCLGLAWRLAHDKNPFQKPLHRSTGECLVNGMDDFGDTRKYDNKLDHDHQELYGLYGPEGTPNWDLAKKLYPNVEFIYLSAMNDTQQKSFRQIGEWLEKYPEVYFKEPR